MISLGICVAGVVHHRKILGQRDLGKKGKKNIKIQTQTDNRKAADQCALDSMTETFPRHVRNEDSDSSDQCPRRTSSSDRRPVSKHPSTPTAQASHRFSNRSSHRSSHRLSPRSTPRPSSPSVSRLSSRFRVPVSTLAFPSAVESKSEYAEITRESIRDPTRLETKTRIVTSTTIPPARERSATPTRPQVTRDAEETCRSATGPAFPHTPKAQKPHHVSSNHCAHDLLMPEMQDLIKLHINSAFPELQNDEPDLSGEVFWLEKKGTADILSMLVVNVQDESQPTLWNVCTVKAERRKGYSSRLITEAQRWLALTRFSRQGLLLTVLSTNTEAIKLYLRHHFDFVSEEGQQAFRNALHQKEDILTGEVTFQADSCVQCQVIQMKWLL